MNGSHEKEAVISTGLPTLDLQLGGGFKRGELVCFGSHMSTQRYAFGSPSSLSANLALEHVRNGGKILFIDYEVACK